MFAVAQESKTVVVVAATHTDSVAFIVKNREWSDDDIEFFRRDRRAGDRFPDAKMISFQPRIARNPHELQFARVADDGGENRFIHTPGALKYRIGVDFIAGRNITSEILGAQKKRRSQEAAADTPRIPTVQFGIELCA